MPRRRAVPKRIPVPDTKYGDVLVAKFINNLMVDGKKSTAEKVMYDAFDKISARAKTEDPVAVFKKALDNVRPQVEVKSRRVGGSTYQVPVEVRPERRTALAIRWILTFARNRGEKGMSEKLANELLDASQMRGASVKRREDTHRMADANKAFAHYRW